MAFSRVAATVALALTLVAHNVRANTYSLTTSTVGSDFFNDYTFEAIPDPTNGRVNYIDQATAQSLNLAYATGNSFVMASDDTTVLSSSGPGRNSIRIQSNQAYNTHVTVFNIQHMPQGLGTWPAAWEVGPNWPDGGEVDVVEGVNDVVPNASTLHTGPGCTMPSSSVETGNRVTTDCNANDNGNAGCGVQTNKANNYGPDFNGQGGGWYAMERTPTDINVWFWSRTDGSVPQDLAQGQSSINTNNWGTPVANFPNTDCNIADEFQASNIIINLTFCGDWAGAVFNQDGGSGDCNDYVDNNPSAFSEAYWTLLAVNVYE